MKVGIYLNISSPLVGGGYTFEKEIFRSLVKCCENSKHRFVILGQNEKLNYGISTGPVEYLSLSPFLTRKSKTGWLAKISRVKLKVLRKVGAGRSNIAAIKDNTLGKFIASKGIEFLWYLKPSDFITLDIPFITVVWDLQHRLQPYFPEVSLEGSWAIREKMYREVLQRAAVILTGTQVGKADVERFFQVPSERIKVIPFPVPDFAIDKLSASAPDIRRKYGVAEEYLLYPAQFWPHKNHAGLLKAVRRLSDKYGLNFDVVFTGSDKGNQDYIRQLVGELGLSERVHFLGFVSQQDLTMLYRQAFSLTFLTFFGPDNIPPLEAFALQCPVIASKVAGSEEQLGDAALLVDPMDIEEVALAIKSLHDKPELRRELVHRGLNHAAQNTGRNYVEKVFSILDEFEAIRSCWNSSTFYSILK